MVDMYTPGGSGPVRVSARKAEQLRARGWTDKPPKRSRGKSTVKEGEGDGSDKG